MGDKSGPKPLSVADNPPEPAPPYPGKFWRNNKKGVAMTKEQWIQEQVFQWVVYMKDKPAYSRAFLSTKAKVLLPHLSKFTSKTRKTRVTPLWASKVDYPSCRRFIQEAERNLQLQQDTHEIQVDMSNLDNPSTSKHQSDNIHTPSYNERNVASKGEKIDRTDREFEIERLLKMCDEELFTGEDDSEISEKVKYLLKSPKIKNGLKHTARAG